MAGPKQARSPRSQTKTPGLARAGNYSAPIDTSGVDESMKETLGIKPAPPPTTKPPATPGRQGIGAVMTGFFRRAANSRTADNKAQMGRVINSSGNTRSPSTVVDKSAAELEAIAKKYVD